MLPALAKLRFYSHATVAVHFFVNAYFQEVHALLCGASERTEEVVRSERRRRATAEELRPSGNLPSYIAFELETKRALDLFRERDEEYAVPLKGDLLELMKNLATRSPDEFDNHVPKSTDTIIVLPLRSSAYMRLGWFVLWAPDNQLRKAAERDREIRSTFQNRFLQLIVRIFTNFYGMEPGTYLPSYYKPSRKAVTLLCAQIRDFDRIWSNIELHGGLDADAKRICRMRLLEAFGRAAASAVEKNKGRIDQNWGNGLLAVFGEYPIVPETSAHLGVKSAMAAASDLVQGFEHACIGWTRDVFRADAFNEFTTALNMSPTVGIGIDWGPVIFDYFGGEEHRIFMAVGERTIFARDLAAVAGRIPSEHHQETDGGTNICWLDEYRGTPILMSHAAFIHGKSVISNPVQRAINLPGRSERTFVYPIDLRNVQLTSQSFSSGS
jgi:class 3 adenylate cyclase